MSRHVLVLLLLHTSWTNAFRFKTFLNMAILDDLVSSAAEVTKPCECRARCWEDAPCRGVTVTPLSTRGTTVCLFTTHTPTLPSYGGLMGPTQGAHSFLKKMPCLTDFMDVEGVGCLQLRPPNITYADAKTSCPEGSDLFSPSNSATFRSMQDYLLGHLPDVSHNYWIGVERRPDGVTWQWRKGSYMDPRVTSVYWLPPEPNQGYDCARMAYAADYSYFTLADFPCTNNYAVICEQF